MCACRLQGRFRGVQEGLPDGAVAQRVPEIADRAGGRRVFGSALGLGKEVDEAEAGGGGVVHGEKELAGAVRVGGRRLDARDAVRAAEVLSVRTHRWQVTGDKWQWAGKYVRRTRVHGTAVGRHVGRGRSG